MSKELEQLLDAYEWIGDISSKVIINLVKTTKIFEEIFSKHYKKFDLSEPQFNVLYLLSLEEKGVTLSELGERMLVTRANITKLMDRMEASGLVQRIENEEDRRSVKAQLTDKGAELLDKIIPFHVALSKELTSFLTDADKERANELLTKIQRELIKKDLDYGSEIDEKVL